MASVRIAALIAWWVVAGTAAAFAQDPAPAAEVLRGPYLQALFDTSVEVRWLTDVPVEGRVRVEAQDGTVVEAAGPEERDHRLRVDGLQPATRYTYEVLAGDEVVVRAPELRFRTAPPPGEGSFRAVVTGDSGNASRSQYDVAAVIESVEADIFLHTGDLLYVSSVDSGIFRPYRSILSQTCFFPSRGNHDFAFEGDDGEPLAWRDLFTVPNDSPGRTGAYYSYDWGPAHFLVLDYFPPPADASEQLEFAEEDLRGARARGVAWLIVYQHVPIYSAGTYANLQHPIRELVARWCDEFAVDLVLSGHDHNYQRTYPVRGGVLRDGWQDPDFLSPRGTVYVVTGGGGAGLYPERPRSPQRALIARFHSRYHCVAIDVSPASLHLRALGLGGELFDEIVLRKDRPRPALEFLRGDATRDRRLSIIDPVTTLEYLFTGGTLECPAAASPFDDGAAISVTDAIYVLDYLFNSGPLPAPPFPDCGPAPEADDAFCLTSGC
jgi:hypothetical protein